MRARITRHEWNAMTKGPIEVTLVLEPSAIDDHEIRAWLDAYFTGNEVEIDPPRPVARPVI